MEKKSPLYSLLEIPGFLTSVRLGCGSEERAWAQPVVFSIKVGFYAPLTAEASDRLGETFCYAEICEKIEERVRPRSYQLVESLARDVWRCLESSLPQGARLQVRVHKRKPPVEGLTQGVFYTTGDMDL